MTTYYTKIFGTVMTVTPVYYEFEKGQHFVYVLGDVNDEKETVQLIRMGADMLATHKRRFKPNNYSRQRLGIHFRNTLPPVPKESVERVTTVPTIQVIQDALK